MNIENAIAKGLDMIMKELPEKFQALIAKETTSVSPEVQKLLLKWYVAGSSDGIKIGADIINDLWLAEIKKNEHP